MRAETLREAQNVVNLMPNTIRRASEGIARDIGRIARGEKPNNDPPRGAHLLACRIVELVEARIMLRNANIKAVPQEPAKSGITLRR